MRVRRAQVPYLPPAPIEDKVGGRQPEKCDQPLLAAKEEGFGIVTPSDASDGVAVMTELEMDGGLARLAPTCARAARTQPAEPVAKRALLGSGSTSSSELD